MENEITRTKIISSIFWRFLEFSGEQGIQLLVLVILTRLLLPEDFGLIVLVTIFISVATVITQSGFNTALIQKKTMDEADLSSVFYVNLLISTILYFILFMIAPFLASFFEHPQLTLIIRLLSLSLILRALHSIQNVIIIRNMQFKKLFTCSIGGVILSGIIGILMAYTGFGVWSLVVQQLVNNLVYTITIVFIVAWRPRLIFSIGKLRGLFSYGWKILVSSLIDSIYLNISNLIIGKMFSPAILGFYNRGEQIPGLLVSNINGSIQSVLFPALSTQQENKKRVKEMVRRAMVTSAFIIFPMMIGLAVIAETLVKIVLTEKWMPVVPFLQIFCFIYILWPIRTANLQAINALGRSDIYLKLEIAKKMLGIVILTIALQHGIYAIVMGMFITNFLSLFIDAYPNSILLDYRLIEQFFDVFPSLFISLIMGVTVLSIKLLGFTNITTLIMQIFVGFIFYIILAKVFKLEPYTYLIEIIKGILINNKKARNKQIYE
ncbi:lipopolysaccharide biosynthesis protein [Solibacillus isronensis]|uniref:lipopolysaccharide biosynthesis protein n=1 Tax=Solibacillus isronensis TaxID=412383 RepID=UPI0002D4A1B6|nr:lipopolysaccharide biosynthesis protein [Solibacillus isronensis]AMO84781.1 lipopolysaccharide biosynthesis protein [Solibacillus silvestris]